MIIKGGMIRVQAIKLTIAEGIVNANAAKALKGAERPEEVQTLRRTTDTQARADHQGLAAGTVVIHRVKVTVRMMPPGMEAVVGTSREKAKLSYSGPRKEILKFPKLGAKSFRVPLGTGNSLTLGKTMLGRYMLCVLGTGSMHILGLDFRQKGHI